MDALFSAEDAATAPCLLEGPLRDAAPELLAAVRGLGTSRLAVNFRALSVPYLFNAMEEIFDSGVEPGAALDARVRGLAQWYKSVNSGFWRKLESGIVDPADPRRISTSQPDVEQVTGEHFGRLFADFVAETFWRHPLNQFRARIERNGINVSLLEGKDVLDAGCGAGRLAFVFKELGAQCVVGIDISESALDLARRRQKEIGVTGLEFQQGSVLQLPFADNSFDIVFSSGVYHHTTDWRGGVKEFIRVLKPDGLGLLYYLNEKPGGLFWDIVELLRVMVKGDPLDWMRQALSVHGLPGPRIIYLLDPLMVPINVRLTTGDIEDFLREIGAIDVRRFTRGADRDRLERIYQNESFAREKFGIGENRYAFGKPRAAGWK